MRRRDRELVGPSKSIGKAVTARMNLAADFEADASTFGRSPMALGYNVRTKGEVDPLMQRAAEAGASILKPAQEASWAATPAISQTQMTLRGR